MNELLTVKEVAQILRTNVDMVYKLRDSGLISFLKLGQWKVTRKELERFLNDNVGKDLSNPYEVKNLTF